MSFMFAECYCKKSKYPRQTKNMVLGLVYILSLFIAGHPIIIIFVNIQFTTVVLLISKDYGLSSFGVVLHVHLSNKYRQDT